MSSITVFLICELVIVCIFTINKANTKVCHGSEETRIVDISHVYDLPWINSTIEKTHTYKFIQEKLKSQNNCAAPILLYFYTVLSENFTSEVLKMASFVESLHQSIPKFTPVVIIGARDPWSIALLPKKFKTYLNFTTIYQSMGSTLRAIALESTDISTKCHLQMTLETELSIVEYAKTHISSFTEIEVGYILNPDFLSCRYHKVNIESSDFLILDVVVDKSTSSSYNIFKQQLLRVEELTFKHLETDRQPVKPVYHRVKLELQPPKTYGVPRKTGPRKRMAPTLPSTINSNPKAHLFPNHTLLEYQFDNYFANYSNLIGKYVREFVATSGKSRMIIFTVVEYGNVDSISTNKNLIAVLPQYSVSESNLDLVYKSNKILMEDINNMGIDKVYLDKQTQTIAYHCLNTTTLYAGFELVSLKTLGKCLNNQTKIVYNQSRNQASPFGLSKRSAIYELKLHLQREIKMPFSRSNFVCRHLISIHGFSVQKIVTNTLAACKPEFTGVKQVLLALEFSELYRTHWALESIVEKVLDYLDDINIVRALLRLEYPDITVTLDHRKLQYIPDDPVETVQYERLYCNRVAEKLSKYYESVLTWANIHNFPIIIRDHIDLKMYNSPVTWEPLVAVKNSKLNSIMRTFRLFIRRSYNSSKLFQRWAAEMFPCIKKSKIESSNPRGRIDFGHGYSGACLDFNLRSAPLQISEMQLLLIYSLQKFAVLEVLNLSASIVRVLIEAISDPTFITVFYENISLKPQILLDVSDLSVYQLDTLPILLTAFRDLGIQKTSIHFEIVSRLILSDYMVKLIEIREEFSLQVGVKITDCISEAQDLLLDSVDRGNKSENYFIFSKVDYILCLDQQHRARNSENFQMQDFLDGKFYINKVLTTLLKNVESVYFRVNLQFSNDTQRVSNWLAFLSDTNQYAEQYKVHIFLTKAFSKENSSEMEPSWWSISSYSDLTNVSSFNEHESIFYKLPQWTPELRANGTGQYEDFESNYKTFMFVAILGGILVLFVAATVIVVQAVRIRQQSKILSDAETQEFLNGRLNKTNNGIPLNEYHERFEFTGYNAEIFEIDKEDIKINKKKLLGFGEFGLVYCGILQREAFIKETIAVKMPRDNYSKQSVKAMLREIKLLSYVGSHNNLINFIGSYTKEIQNGIVWICTEYCSNGTLQNFLRQAKEQGLQEKVLPDLSKFAREIACGMNYISGRNVVHGDLSTRNVLLDKYNTCKIGDFGLSKRLYEYKATNVDETGPMPWRWMAYESLSNMTFSVKSDVWSYAVTLWEIFTFADVPFAGLIYNDEFIKDLQSGMRLRKPEYADEEGIYAIMCGCWLF